MINKCHLKCSSINGNSGKIFLFILFLNVLLSPWLHGQKSKSTALSSNLGKSLSSIPSGNAQSAPPSNPTCDPPLLTLVPKSTRKWMSTFLFRIQMQILCRVFIARDPFRFLWNFSFFWVNLNGVSVCFRMASLKSVDSTKLNASRFAKARINFAQQPKRSGQCQMDFIGGRVNVGDGLWEICYNLRSYVGFVKFVKVIGGINLFGCSIFRKIERVLSKKRLFTLPSRLFYDCPKSEICFNNI